MKIKGKNIILNGELNDYRSHHKQMRIFAYEEFKKSRDILSIAYSVFNLEKIVRKEKFSNVKIGRFLDSHSSDLSELLSELISYVLLEKINFEFYNSDNRFYLKEYDCELEKDTNAMLLFSGGIDSLAGIFWAKKYFEKITGVFCAHSDQAWAINTVNKLSNKYLSKNNIDLKTIHVPKIQKGGYSQLRGFLYILSAGVWLDILELDTIVLSECGPTMYQPRFGPYDNVTMTTHPVVVDLAKRVLETILEKKIKIILPFENMTKAEVISYIPNELIISNTHSCISQRFGTHDGTCYGCVIRRLGSLASNRKDVHYDRDPILDAGANNDNLLSLLLFSQDILLNYRSMPLYQVENIMSYHKFDLFKRFALDNFAAVHSLKSRGKKPIGAVQRIYNDYIDIKGINSLEKRIRDLKKKKFQINENAKR